MSRESVGNRQYADKRAARQFLDVIYPGICMQASVAGSPELEKWKGLYAAGQEVLADAYEIVVDEESLIVSTRLRKDFGW